VKRTSGSEIDRCREPETVPRVGSEPGRRRRLRRRPAPQDPHDVDAVAPDRGHRRNVGSEPPPERWFGSLLVRRKNAWRSSARDATRRSCTRLPQRRSGCAVGSAASPAAASEPPVPRQGLRFVFMSDIHLRREYRSRGKPRPRCKRSMVPSFLVDAGKTRGNLPAVSHPKWLKSRSRVRRVGNRRRKEADLLPTSPVCFGHCQHVGRRAPSFSAVDLPANRVAPVDCRTAPRAGMASTSATSDEWNLMRGLQELRPAGAWKVPSARSLSERAQGSPLAVRIPCPPAPLRSTVRCWYPRAPYA
jgi:hypothetical protein